MSFRKPTNGIYSDRSKDILMNPELLIPPRPTISNIQWISGTQHVTPADMDLLSKSTSVTASIP
jgi:syntaxin-binding protein 5